MTSIETYQEQIDTVKANIDALKGDKPLTIHNLPGRAALTVHEWDDFDFPDGTVIAGNGDHAYLRVPHGRTYWVSSSSGVTDPRGYGHGELYFHLRERAAAGEQFRIVHQPGAQQGAA